MTRVFDVFFCVGLILSCTSSRFSPVFHMLRFVLSARFKVFSKSAFLSSRRRLVFRRPRTYFLMYVKSCSLQGHPVYTSTQPFSSLGLVVFRENIAGPNRQYTLYTLPPQPLQRTRSSLNLLTLVHIHHNSPCTLHSSSTRLDIYIYM